MNDELTIEQQLALAEAAKDDETSLERYEGDPGDETDFDPDTEYEAEPDLHELQAGEAVSLEQVLDTIFSILATQAQQIQAIGEYVFGQQTVAQPAEPEVPKLTVVTDLS